MKVAVVGAGLAGAEAAWTLAQHYQLEVLLFEMKAHTPTPAQSEPHNFAELVCSNSLKSKSRLNPAGLLKQEMKALGSLTIKSAEQSEVPAGEALAVDREKFSGFITQNLRQHPKISVIERQVHTLADLNEYNVDATIVATGPLTADPLAENLRALTGSEALYFYDAIAPILDGDTIDTDVAFFANRKSRFTDRSRHTESTPELQTQPEEVGHYLNLPLNREEYFNFVEELIKGEKVPFHNFEEPKFFNGCQPIEVLAESGPKTLSFGPMKPMGLEDPRTGRRPFAAVQLRREKLGDGAYNMVGFQTRLKWPEQKRIFKMLPGLANAEFHRMGSMHRNTYMIAPGVLQYKDLALINAPKVWIAGQLSGVEGYVESAAMGLLTAHIVGHKLTRTEDLNLPPADTALGCLVAHLRSSDPKHYTPMNIHWGLYSDVSEEWIAQHEKHYPEIIIQKTKKKLDKSVKRSILALRSETLFENWLRKEKL